MNTLLFQKQNHKEAMNSQLLSTCAFVAFIKAIIVDTDTQAQAIGSQKKPQVLVELNTGFKARSGRMLPGFSDNITRDANSTVGQFSNWNEYGK